MTTRTNNVRHAGFSLMEVLIALVVLSFGLLALAALQTSVFKASAEAKSQSVALGLAAEKLEFFRGYNDIDVYRAINSGADGAAISVGGVDFSRAWIVTRYAFPVAGVNFTNSGVGNTANLATNLWVENNEFKRIQVNVTWVDAQGMAQRVSLEDALAGIAPGDSAKIGKLSSTTVSRGPEKRIYNPALAQEGVIPIGYGSGDTNTAATNPKPLVNGTNVLETRFDVLTYSGISATVIEQARVETSLVGCACDYDNAPTGTTERGKRPTYWNGSRYVIPEDTTYVPEAGLDDSVTSQSDMCTVCCRDHHDPSGLATGSAKFDPRNTAHTSGHYLLNSSTGALGPQVTTGKYTEVCRVIRVDGFFRVAADTYGDYTNLLETNSFASTPDVGKSVYVPTADASAKYEAFVKAYLDSRVVSSLFPDDTIVTLNEVLAEDVTSTSTLEENRINSVTGSISLQGALNFDKNDATKWLHLRGLYIDYLEDAAVQAIKDAKENCVGTGTGGAVTATDLESCVLSVLPFTSINLTELGQWTPTTGTQIVVAGNNVNFASTLTSTEPVRGRVIYGANPTNGQTTNAASALRRSNSGLTTVAGGIDPDDALTTVPSTWTATQPFTMTGFGVVVSGGTFTVYLDSGTSNYTYSTPNIVNQYINSSLAGTTCNFAIVGDPVTCTTSSTLGGAQTLTVGRYNYSTSGKSNQSGLGNTALTCTNTATNATFTHVFNGQGKTVNICKNFQLASSNNGGVVGTVLPSDGALTESTTVIYAALSNLAVINLNFQTQPDSLAYTCSYTGNNVNQDNNYAVTAATCP